MQCQFSSAQEQQVGIKKYISTGPQIPAITKYLLSDFVVNQINQQGNVIALKSIPDLKNIPQNAKEKPSYVLSAQAKERIVEVLGKEVLEKLVDLYEKLQSGDKVGEWVHTIENIPSQKQERTKIHNLVREHLINIESTTVQGNKMKLRLNKKMKKIDPSSRNKYIHFILFKSNIDTMGAIFRLSKLTGISQKVFSTAGLKDKRGVTTQMVSVYNSDINSLKKFYNFAQKNKEIWIEGFKEHMVDSVGIGDLYGNQFGLILRLLNSEKVDIIKERIESIREVGMINYFGMQRFGSCGTKTHMIGVLIVQRKWKEIVESLILEETKDETINKMKKEMFENGQYGRAERSLSNKYKTEKNLFKALSKHGLNYQNAFQSTPRSMRTLYCHSLQSYIWNRIVTRRIQKYGLTVQIGDLVGRQLKGFEKVMKEVEAEKEEDKEQNQENQEGNEENCEASYEIVLVTEKNISQFELTDVVAPLYGPALTLPEQSIFYQYVKEQLLALNLSFEDFTFNAKKLCFKGQYRKMIVKPKKVDYKIIKHKNGKDQLQSPFYMNGVEKEIEEGQKTSVQLVIQLPKSSYATMALREVLHMPSSFEVQNQLNKLYEVK